MSDDTTSRARAGRAVLWATVGWYSTYLISFAFNIVTARLLAPDVFGLVALVMVVVYLAQLFADAGTRAALIHRQDDIDNAVSTALVSVPLAGIAGTVLIAAASPLFATFYGDDELTWLALAMAPLLFIFTLSIVPDALLQRRMDLKKRRAIVDPLSVVGYGVTVIIGALMGLEEWALVIGQYVNFLTITIGAWVLARPRFRAGRASWLTYRSISKYGRGLLLANAVESIGGQLEPIALGRNLGPEDVGLWNAGLRIGKLPLTGIVQVTGSVVFAALARFQDDLARFRAVAFEALQMNSLLVLPISVTFMTMGESIVVVLFGETWRGAGIALQFIGFTAITLSLGDNGREIFKAIGRPYLVARSATIEAIASVGWIAVIWITGNVAIWTIGLGRVISSSLILGAYAVGVHRIGALRYADQWRAVRAALAAGVVQAVVLVVIMQLLPSGPETWHHILGVPLGPIPALLGVGGLFVLGVACYAGIVRLIDRSALGQLRANVRTAVRGKAA